MSSFKDKLKNMAAEKKIAAHPLVEKLNANLNTRSSYWLAFALYAKVEEKELDDQLIDLGKSLRLDDAEIKEELAAVKGCESDEDFESLVRECAAGLVDEAVRILLLMELDHFSKENSLDPDFVSTLSDIIELSADEKTFLCELKEILKSKTPDIEKFSAFLSKNANQPTEIFELYFPELYQMAKVIPDGAAEFLIKEIEKKAVSSKDSVDKLRYRIKPETLQVPEKMNDADKKFKQQYPQTVLSLTRKAAFHIYKTRIGEMFSQFEEWVKRLDSDNEFDEWPFDTVVSRNLTLRWYFQYHMGIRNFELDNNLFHGIEFGGEDDGLDGLLVGKLMSLGSSKAMRDYGEKVRQRIKFRKEAITKVREFFDNELSEMGKHYS